MNILLLGSGGREHTFAWKMSQSSACDQLYIAPGNAGTAACGTNVDLSPNNFELVGQFCLDHAIDMVVVGPEEPLVRGIVDFFNDHTDLQQIAIIGPDAQGAQLEGSKAFAKKFMEDRGIPTAAYREFSKEELEEGLRYLNQQPLPIVLKADGLAAGKGVLICQTLEEAREGFREMLEGKFGDASARVVVEAFLDGIEFSVFVLTDGKDYKILPVAKDYKRIGEGDTGLNTGGMGAVSPPQFVTDSLMEKVEQRVIIPTMEGIRESGMNYKGFIFLGLIRVDQDPFVIEYNCRMGDPETEVVFPRLKSDLVELLVATANQQLADQKIEMEEKAAATVMLVSGGYPEAYEKGKEMTGWEKVDGSLLFHAGTRADGEKVLTNGGRVLAITSYGEDVQQAIDQSKSNAEAIQFDGKYYRKDIGFDLH